MSKALLPALALTVNALVWGLSWWPFRQLEHAGLHPLWATALIYGLSLTLILLVWPGALRAMLRHPMLWWLMLAAGITNVGFNWAVTVGDVVRVVLLFYLMPTWSMLLAWWLLGERPGRAALLRLALALTGVLVMLKSPGTDWPLPQQASDWLALLGGMSFALTNILLRRLADTPKEARMLAMFGGGMLLAGGTAAAGWFGGQIAAPTLTGGHGALLLLTLGFLAGNLALQYGAARLSAHATALLMLSEIVFAGVSSVALGAAVLEWRTAVGGGFILLAAVLATAASTRAAAQPA